MPNVFTIGLQWIQNIEIENDKLGRFKEEVNKKDIEKILELIPCSLDLTDFYQTQQSSQTPKPKHPYFFSSFGMSGKETTGDDLYKL